MVAAMVVVVVVVVGGEGLSSHSICGLKKTVQEAEDGQLVAHCKRLASSTHWDGGNNFLEPGPEGRTTPLDHVGPVGMAVPGSERTRHLASV